MRGLIKDLAMTAAMAGAVAGGLTAGTALVAGPAHGSEVRTEMPRRYDQPWLNRPCQYEDSIQCYWNAGTMGNGYGHSFYAIRLGNGKRGNVRVAIVYWNLKYNRTHGYVINNW